MTEYIWMNGRYLKSSEAYVSHKDGGFLRGLGVFDTMLGLDGKAQNIEEHYKRLSSNAETVLLSKPSLSIDDLSEVIDALLHKNQYLAGAYRIRTQLTVGNTKEMLGKPDKLLMMVVITPLPQSNSNEALKAKIVNDYPRIANCRFENCKRLDYTRSYFAKHTALDNGYNEAIITNSDGNIACATTSNLFIIEDDHYITPPLNQGVLEGITRRNVIKTYNAKEDIITTQRLMNAKCVFLTNSIYGIRPIEKIDDNKFEVSHIKTIAA